MGTVAGGTLGFSNGPASAAMFSFPVGIDIDSYGTLFVADGENYGGGSFSNNAIRTISPSGNLSTYLYLMLLK